MIDLWCAMPKKPGGVHEKSKKHLWVESEKIAMRNLEE